MNSAPRQNPPSQQYLDRLAHSFRHGSVADTEELASAITQEFPTHPFAWKVLGALYVKTNRNADAVTAYEHAAELAPQDPEVQYNLGICYRTLHNFREAEVSYRRAIKLSPDHVEAHNNLGLLLKNSGRLAASKAYFYRAVELNPRFALAHNNLGNVFYEQGLLPDAESCYRKASELVPNFLDAKNNLCNTLRELGKLREATAICMELVKSHPADSTLLINLGNILRDQSQVAEAESFFRRATDVNPQDALAHNALGKTLFSLGKIELALASVKRATHLDPRTKEYGLLEAVIGSQITHGSDKKALKDQQAMSSMILHRDVEPELISALYGMKTQKLESTLDARFGTGVCSAGFELFEISDPVVNRVAEDLKNIMRQATGSRDIYVYDSFFNILSAGGGSTPHNHLNKLDADPIFSLAIKKFSLVYYLSVGDQDCAEPGMLKLFDPEEEILPNNGTMVIIPGARKHCAVYGGIEDRIMVGVNFYSI